MGQVATDTASAFEATELEVLRRHGNAAWGVSLERMTTAPVILREVARQLALQAYLQWSDTKLRMLELGLAAGHTAADARRDYDRAFQQLPAMPIPLAGGTR